MIFVIFILIRWIWYGVVVEILIFFLWILIIGVSLYGVVVFVLVENLIIDIYEGLIINMSFYNL